MAYRPFATRGNSSRAGDRGELLISQQYNVSLQQRRRKRRSWRGLNVRVLTLACLLSVAFLPLVFSVYAAPPSYVYDDAGRLIAVIDPTGDTAVYSYDAVGNLLGITRQPSTTLAILNFTPKSGPVGTVVTIYGTGFDPTPSQNTVTFNGTAASVTSASATQLVATVPGGATSGPIGVTTPSGSTTSAESFTVTTGGPLAGAPTITSFTPTVGAPGTTVTITGTNFASAPADNKVAFNITQSQVSAAAATSLTTSVPASAGSGRITVATVGGAAVSDMDFIVPPGAYTATDIGSTARITVGQSVTMSLATANKVAPVLFDGSAGQRVSVHITNSTISSCASSFSNLYAPDGVQLVTTYPLCTGTFINPYTLPISGTYTLLLKASGSATGQVTLTLYDVPPDITGPITPGGPAVTVTTTAPGQEGRLTFVGTENQKISVLVNSTTLSCVGGGNVRVKQPDDTVIGSVAACANNFLDATTLPVTGTHTLQIDPAGANTGSVTTTLYLFDDVTGTITPGDPAVTVAIPTPGQTARLTFSGVAGQRIFVQINASTVTSCGSGQMVIEKPDGLTTVTSGLCSGDIFDTQTLAQTGTYTLVLNPTGIATGEITLTLFDVPADVTGSITPGGSPVSVNITVSGQNGQLTFDGVAGQRVSVLVTNSTITNCSTSTGSLRLRKPDGTTLTSGNLCTNTFFDAQTLPTTGVYTISINPPGANTGEITLALYDIIDVTGTLVLNDPPLTVTLPTPGQNGQFTFAGAASQLVTVRLTNNIIGSTAVRLLKPDGSVLGSVTSGSTNFNMAQKTLPTTGTYTVTIDPTGSRTGSIGVQVTNP